MDLPATPIIAITDPDAVKAELFALAKRAGDALSAVLDEPAKAKIDKGAKRDKLSQARLPPSWQEVQDTLAVIEVESDIKFDTFRKNLNLRVYQALELNGPK